jgi:hypothetical protein
MNLEEKKVLLSRSNLIKEWHNKEWWYTGFYEPNENIYFSFFFVRVNLIDQFSFTLFDPEINKTIQFTKKLYLEKEQKKNMLCLNYHSKKLIIEYNGNEEIGWKFTFKNKNFSIELKMTPTTPCFTKSNDEFIYKYTLLHYFNILTSGFIRIENKTYSIDHALCYYDHCFGTVSSKTGWHWIAVQNGDVALASLVNYGAYAQRYTQVYFKKNKDDFCSGRWIRLNQDVSFEHLGEESKFSSDWKGTSPEMHITITPIMHVCNIEKIPPVLPFLINLRHNEYFIKVNGKVRVDGYWVETGELYGVMEEHWGRW